MTANQSNWAGNCVYSTARVHCPHTVEQVRQLVVKNSNLRALGTRHSFNKIADSIGDLVSLENLNRVVDLNRAGRKVTVEAGIKYGQLGEYLHSEGYALPNLASLPHISVAGACATATHGSGDANGNLATAVRAIELVTADGDVLVFSHDQHGERFCGMVVALGGLGVVTKLTLDIIPSFAIQQQVYERLPMQQLEAHYDEITSSAYSVSLFTDWQSEFINQVWLKRRVTYSSGTESAPTFFGAKPAPTHRHPIVANSAENCTAQMGILGASHERLPHFRMNYTPSNGAELQTEYFVPRAHAVAAFRAIAELRAHLAPLLLISELRTVAADALWLSPCYQQASAAIHFTWKQNWPAVRKLLPMIEAQLAPFRPRPHWAKLFTIPQATLRSLYEKLPDFQRLLLDCDPAGKFQNAFLKEYIINS